MQMLSTPLSSNFVCHGQCFLSRHLFLTTKIINKSYVTLKMQYQADNLFMSSTHVQQTRKPRIYCPDDGIIKAETLVMKWWFQFRYLTPNVLQLDISDCRIAVIHSTIILLRSNPLVKFLCGIKQYNEII